MVTTSEVGGAVAGVTVIVPIRVTGPMGVVPVIVTVVGADTAAVLTANVPLEFPFETTASVGTVTMAGLLLVSVTIAPLVAVLKVTVPVAAPPPATVDGLNVMD
jgi:hypothetical protein